MEKEELIKILKDGILSCEANREDMNEKSSWGYKTGVLLTGNEAHAIIDLLSAPLDLYGWMPMGRDYLMKTLRQ